MILPFFLVFTLAYISIPVDANYPCQTRSFILNCCIEGDVNGQKFNLITETHPTHSCMGFNTPPFSGEGDIPPLMFGTWEGDTLYVRLMTGSSPGLCLENFGMPVVGFCGMDINSWQSGSQGCGCNLLRKKIVCSDRKVTEAQSPTSNSDCGLVVAPSENDYRLYTQEECQNYMAALPFDED